MSVTVHHGDCLDVMRGMAEASVDSVVTDPPYHLTGMKAGGGAGAVNPSNKGQTASPYSSSSGFMGCKWDGGDIAFRVELWGEAFRVLKPGGHIVAFSGTRTYHRMACAIEDAGFEIRDQLSWIYGSGFPKSRNVGKAFDKRRHDSADVLRVTAFVRAARDAAGSSNKAIDALFSTNGMAGHWTAAVSSRPRVPTWEQWLQLKTLLRLPDDMDAEVWRLNGRKGQPGDAWHEREIIGERTTGIGTGKGSVAYIDDSDNRDITAPATDLAKQWDGWGTALKPAHEPMCLARKPLIGTVAANVAAHGTGALNVDGCRIYTDENRDRPRGSFPHSDDAWGNGHFAETAGHPAGRWPANVCHDGSDEVLEALARFGEKTSHDTTGIWNSTEAGTHQGNAQRKPGRGDTGTAARFFFSAKASREERGAGNNHPTVKPLPLMQWLCRLVTPPGGTVLDPFLGSGSTAIAADREGFSCIGIEQEGEYIEITRRRIAGDAGLFAEVLMS